ncbi:DUF4157 domain-containing protein [Hymenobacter sp. BT662]|uniref:DUF4157 domain-containing protein n=2 Tax=Hymenobacter ruricola TaxID=2791023 RepID=A0ABS0I375_9BACT|nr:DUF4157 domain-containing protein [Hymenobacter ruricola]
MQQAATLQRALDGRARAASPAAPVQREEAPTSENTTGLPDELKAGVENLSGHSLDDVQVHYNSAKPAELQAHAYAQGSEIHVAPGQEQHLPHEAWHVAQQKQGRVRPTRQLKGQVPVNDDAGLEREADVMGAKALGGPGPATQLKVRRTAAGPVQRAVDDALVPVLDARMDAVKAEAVAILKNMRLLGEDWEQKYGEMGKEKGAKAIGGEKTDYPAEVRRAILKQLWANMTGEEKAEMVMEGSRLAGRTIGAAVRGGRALASVLPAPEKAPKGERERPKPREEAEENKDEKSVSWFSELSQEEMQALYEAYSTFRQVRKKYQEAVAKVNEAASEAGKLLGGEVGKLRNEFDFNKRMDALKSEFLAARKRYELLKAAIEANKDEARHKSEIAALNFGLMNAIVGPAMVYRGSDLNEETRKKHPDLCQDAITIINASKHGGLAERAEAALSSAGEEFRNFRDGGKARADALRMQQSALAGTLDKVLQKSWRKVTSWGWTPTAVKAIKEALPQYDTDVSKLNKAKELAGAARGNKDSGRYAVTQVFYDALASLNVTDLMSLKVTESIIADVGKNLK